MNESSEQVINDELEKLRKSLKIDTNEKCWYDDLVKELKATNFWYKIYKVIGLIILGGAGIMLILSLLADGETIFGILIKEKYYSLALLIIMIAGMFSYAGKFELKKERIKTFLLLHNLSN